MFRLALLALMAWVTLVADAGPAQAQSGQPDSGDAVTEIAEPKGESSTPSPQLVQPRPMTVDIPGLENLAGGPEHWTSPEGMASSLQVVLLLTVLSLAPAVLLMTTCYVRIIVVLGLLRQAIGLQSLPPSQVMTSIALFMTMFVMTPVWTKVYDEAIKPYTDPEVEMTLEEAYEAGSLPIREFMSKQIWQAKNTDDVILFYSYMDPDAALPSTFEEVPMRVLLPAYILSELKVAFLMGFRIFLPFLIVDLVVASVTISMGMLMLPPQVISLPFKLLLFVLVDGWHMVVTMLMNSFGTIG
ncbi:Flagellar biosynthetic protein FliP precursor [Rubripirellula amarantea]|uniref:Flagellar biosynthetic protein FliP n=1 Tax=Rubripirellula amarantea TaxID=2527999 RepID=A0A5C5WRL0_9BACT|nr:Flagellar biosynthetic protein FliP precursor [Rubripirellula amarantea]